MEQKHLSLYYAFVLDALLLQDSFHAHSTKKPEYAQVKVEGKEKKINGNKWEGGERKSKQEWEEKRQRRETAE